MSLLTIGQEFVSDFTTLAFNGLSEVLQNLELSGQIHSLTTGRYQIRRFQIHWLQYVCMHSHMPLVTYGTNKRYKKL